MATRDLRAAFRRGRRGDRAAVAVLVAVPVLLFALPALAGHLVAPGDDLIQNLPLRALVGADLRSGHLPLLDPYIWSGTPLLGGWNAGAAYPLTWLFALLPAGAAWTVGLVVTWWVAGLGVYFLLRDSALAPVACFLGAFCFVFGGAMTSQVSHVGLVEGFAWVPWAVLALRDLARARSLRHRLGDVAALGVLVALTVLAGEPRAAADAAVVLAVLLVWECLRTPHRRAFLAAATAALALGAALSALQWLPGLDALAVSQRSDASYRLFSAGSLPAPWLSLLAVPDLLGGSGSFGAATFLGGVNLAEVTGYVGLLPLSAAAALAVRVRRRHPAPEWLPWLAVLGAGVLLALGSSTPLGHVLARAPLYGGQRIQSRNLLEVDLALCVLAGHWLDLCLRRPADAPEGSAPTPATTGPARAATSPAATSPAATGRATTAGTTVTGTTSGRTRAATVAAGAPGAVAVAACTWGLLAPVSLLDRLGVRVSHAPAGYRGALVPFLVLGVLNAAAAVALERAGSGASRLRPPRREPPTGATSRTPARPASAPRRRRHRPASAGRGRLAVAAVAAAVCDLLALSVTSVVAVAGGSASALPPATGQGVATVATVGATAVGHRPSRQLTVRGRFALYDPSLADGGVLDALGQPDRNIWDGGYAVGGYGSIADSIYAAGTGTHLPDGGGQDTLAPAAAAGGTLDQLATSVLLAPASALRRPLLASGSAVPRVGARTLVGEGELTWYLGPPLPLEEVTVPAATGGGVGHLEVGVRSPGGRLHWERVEEHGDAYRWRSSPTAAVAVVVRLPRAASARPGPGAETLRLDAPTVRSPAERRDLVLDGPLATALTAAHWGYEGTDGPFAVFADRRASPGVRLLPTGRAPLAGASLEVTAGPPVAPSAVRVASAHGALVVRAVAAIPGWTASWQPSPARPGARTRRLAVRRRGLVQAVVVPAGRGVLTWSYQAPGFAAGAALSGLGLLALSLAGWWARRRRARAGAVRGGPGG